MSVCRKPGFKKNMKEHNTADIPITGWNFCPKLLSISVARNHFWAAQINRCAEPLGCHLAALAAPALQLSHGRGPAPLLPWDGAALPTGSPNLSHSRPFLLPFRLSSHSEEGRERRSCVLLPARVGLAGAASPPSFAQPCFGSKIPGICSWPLGELPHPEAVPAMGNGAGHTGQLREPLLHRVKGWERFAAENRHWIQGTLFCHCKKKLSIACSEGIQCLYPLHKGRSGCGEPTCSTVTSVGLGVPKPAPAFPILCCHAGPIGQHLETAAGKTGTTTLLL